jgi:hypothetical protein
MNYQAVAEQGRREFPTEEALARGLRRVLTTPEMAAPLARWLEWRREAYRSAAESQTLCAHHAALAHCAGSAFALTGLLEELQRMVDHPAPEDA